MEQTIIEPGLSSNTSLLIGYIHSFLQNMGIPETWIRPLNLLILLIATVIIAFILQKLVKSVLTFILKKVHKVTRLDIFKYTIKNRLPHFLGLVIPLTFIINAIPVVLADYPELIKPSLKLTDIYMVFMVIWTIMSVVRSFIDELQMRPAFINKPMQSYVQVVQIILYIFGAVAIFSILTGKSATVFFTAMGAASAVLMLMFKDTIMGFVSSIQISTNQMVMIGDWITMSKYGADGDVEEINLTTVKVRNFDKTITTIPTYALISDSFQNWRGMKDSGGRRIKRSLIIKQSDIRTLTEEELDNYQKIDAFADYIKNKRTGYNELNKKLNIDPQSIVKGYGITNCDLFIRYAMWYLRNNPEIHQNMTLMVRELSPTVNGLPLEVYVFTNTTAWIEYERIAGEVFNHLIANVKNFGLTIYEQVSGTDMYNVEIQNNASSK